MDIFVIVQCKTPIQNGKTLYIVVYSFGNLLSFGLGYEKSIAGISGAAKFHVFARCIDLFVFRHSGKSAGPYTG
jgi:hypothetical protein